MKIYLLIITILVICVSGFGQTKTINDLKSQVRTFKKHDKYKVSYDKTTDTSSIIYFGSLIVGKPAYMDTGHMIELLPGFIFDGNILKDSPDDFIITFLATGAAVGLMENKPFYAFADDEKIDLGEGVKDKGINRTFSGAYPTAEFVSCKITREDFEKLAKAKKLVIRAGLDHIIPTDDQEAFKNLLIISNR